MTSGGRFGAGTIPRVTEPRIPEELFTDRLQLRAWRSDDLDELAEVFAQPEVWEYPFGRGFERDETERFLNRQIEDWEGHGFGRYAVVGRETGELAGYAGLQYGWWFHEIADEVEVGWRFGRQFWGKGFATEAARATLRVGFDELGVEQIVAVIEPANVSSRHVAERLGLEVVRETTEPTFDKQLLVAVIDRARFDAVEVERSTR